jgi:serine/threonine protein kinase/Tfp pilus assembly protein PilF
MQEQAIFVEALELRDAVQLAAFLDAACAGDQGLRARIERLLERHRQNDSFLNTPAATVADSHDSEQPGARIGPYKLLEQIGEGGFGIVFMAEQQEPIRRKVALKVLKPGMDTKQVVARFEAERQALALMDHPNIAKVLDADQTSSGRPYFVMELVKGVPITEFCDQGQLAPDERLSLFIDVCLAAQHAHQKAIIHRDIKPSNVLVTLDNGAPLVKVIDFGIAKALGQRLTDKTLFTAFAQFVGTPLYMSPEQAALSNIDVDTRSDIYSLGVLLYELLTGTTPFDRERFKNANYDEVRRIIREEEPPTPSTRLSTMGHAAATAAAQRRSDPKQLSRLCRGELDWIVMKALEKDRNRRYETAGALAADVNRYLRDEPVQACPPSAWYLARKFVRRHKMGVAVAAGALLAVGLSLGALAWQLHELGLRRTETERVVSAALAQAKTYLEEGDKQRDYPERWHTTVGLAEAVTQRAEELLTAGAGTAELSVRVHQVREAVDAAQTHCRLLVELDSIHLEQAGILGGRFDIRRSARRYAAVLRDYGVDPSAPEVAAPRIRESRLRELLAAALEDWHRISVNKEERQRLEELLEAVEPAPDVFGAQWRAAVRRSDRPSLTQLVGRPEVQQLSAATIKNLTRDLVVLKEWGAAERLLRPCQLRHRSDFWLNHDLGLVLLKLGPSRIDEALGYFMIAAALRPDNPGVRLNLGSAYFVKKDLDAARREFEAAVSLDAKFAAAHNNLGAVFLFKNDLEAAGRRFEAAIRNDPTDASAHNNLGLVLRRKKDWEGALRNFQAAIAIDPDLAAAHDHLATELYRKNDVAGAIREYQAALSIDPEYTPARVNLGIVLRDSKDLAGAIREFRAAVATDARCAEAYSHLGSVLYATSEFEEAIRMFRTAIALEPGRAAHHSDLGLAFYARKEVEEAIREFKTAIAIDPKFGPAHRNLGNALQDKGDSDQAVHEFQAALEIDPNDAHAHRYLGNALYAKKDRDGAIREFRSAIAIDSKYVAAHYNLAIALQATKDLDGAIREFQLSLSLDPKIPFARYNLGNALHAKNDLDGAIREYRAALAADPRHAEAHCNLGHALVSQGHLAEGFTSLMTGHELGSQRADWKYPSASWITKAERLVQLDAKLSQILQRESQPADAQERLQLADLCLKSAKQLHVAASRFYSEAFAAEPTLADNLTAGHRYRAACAAVQAGCGQGKDTGSLDAQERGRWRKQALAWLQADLALWRQQLDQTSNNSGPAVLKQMQKWRDDAALACVRGPDALAKLPEAERRDWQMLWQDVASLQQRAESTR